MFNRLKRLLNPSHRPAQDPSLARLETALSEIRESYQLSLLSGLDERRQEHADREVTAELMVNLPGDSGFPRNYYRFDSFIAGPVDPAVGGTFVEVHTPLHQPSLASLDLPGLQMTLQPFYWGGCQFLLSGEAKPGLETELVKWFENWIDIDDERGGEGSDFQGVIHSASMSSNLDSGSLCLQVDFGSAPIAAFLELVQLIGRLFRGQVLVDADFANDSQAEVN